MALGAMMFSMPAAVLGTAYASVMHGYGPAQSLGTYALIGSIVLLAAILNNGLSQD